jgi:hypothetical protein
LEAVVLIIRIEVAAGGLEVRSLTARSLMHVDGMFAGGQIVHIERDPDLAAGRRERSCPDVLALAILQINDRGLLGGIQGQGKQQGAGQDGDFES